MMLNLILYNRSRSMHLVSCKFSRSRSTRKEQCTHYRNVTEVTPPTSSAVQKDACACLYIFQISGYWIGKMTNRRELFLRSGSSSSLVSEDNLWKTSRTNSTDTSSRSRMCVWGSQAQVSGPVSLGQSLPASDNCLIIVCWQSVTIRRGLTSLSLSYKIIPCVTCSEGSFCP